MYTFNQIVFSLLCYFFVNSCGEATLLTSVYRFSKNIWHIDQKPCFKFTITNVDQPYDCIIKLSNKANYPYANLYISYCLEGEDVLKHDRFELKLFDKKNGKPLGTGWISKQHDYYLMANYSFRQAGTYKIRLVHAMRQDTLECIENILLVIKPTHLK